MSDRIEAEISSHVEESLAIFDDLTAIGNIDRDEWAAISEASFRAGVSAALPVFAASLNTASLSENERAVPHCS